MERAAGFQFQLTALIAGPAQAQEIREAISDIEENAPKE